MHKLEEEFGLSAERILDVINKHNRCKIAVRGAIAEEHLELHLKKLQHKGLIAGFTALDIDGKPDFIVPFSGRSFTIECKNVRKDSGKTTIDIDFKRTRNPTGRRNASRGPEARFYSPEEFDILAASLWNRTGKWEFAFVATKDLPAHRLHPGRLSDAVVVPLKDGEVYPPWSRNLNAILDRLSR